MTLEAGSSVNQPSEDISIEGERPQVVVRPFLTSIGNRNTRTEGPEYRGYLVASVASAVFLLAIGFELTQNTTPVVQSPQTEQVLPRAVPTAVVEVNDIGKVTIPRRGP